MATIHAFGPFRLDAEANVLFRDGQPAALGQRAVALLRILVERPGALVSKDDLIEAAWSGPVARTGSRPCRAAAIASSVRRSDLKARTQRLLHLDRTGA